MSHHLHELAYRRPKAGFSDRVAWSITRTLRFFADTFFARRYGHRAVVLETVAAVPGMVGGMLQHLSSLRRMRDDHGWISLLLEEAENERMHLMTFIAIAGPTGSSARWCCWRRASSSTSTSCFT